MRTKKVNRYYCDFCKKAGCSAGHMRKHEAGCTNNPNRVCGMCRAGELSQEPMADLLACLPECPDPSNELYGPETPEGERYRNQIALLEDGMKKLRKLCQDCPACIAAALRQKGIPWFVPGFEFKAECKEFWINVNDANATGCY